MNFPAPFLVVSLVFIAIASVLWFIASLPTLLKTGLFNAGVGFYIFPGFLLASALFMIANLPAALQREAAASSDAEASYGPLEFLGNVPVMMEPEITSTPSQAPVAKNTLVFNLLVVLCILATVIPFGMFIYGMFVPGAFRF